jgi:MoxR-like ATPase
MAVVASQVEPGVIHDEFRRYDVGESVARLESVFANLRGHFIHRDHVLEQLCYALLTREHALIIGDRGLAKSRLARSVFAHFEDDRLPFSLQLTRSTSVGQLVGGLDLREFEQGTYIHNLDGYIVRAHFAFLDELFDANDFVLRSLNGILNEREFLNGPQIEPAALHTAIATTNYIRDTRESRAVLDRLLFKCIVHRAENTLERFQIRREFISSHGGTVHPLQGQAMKFDQLHFLSEIVHGENPLHRLSVPPHILIILDEIISHYERKMNETISGDERFVFSDRTKNKCIHVLAASALRSGRCGVEARDLAALHYIVPTVGSGDEEEVFDQAVSTTLKAISPKDRESTDRAASIIDLVADIVTRHREGTLLEPSWTEKVRNRVEKLVHHQGNGPITLGLLMEEARGLYADHKVVQSLKSDLVAAIKSAHEQHHISFDQKLHA